MIISATYGAKTICLVFPVQVPTVSEMNDSITMGNGPRVHFQDDFDSDISDEDPWRLMDTMFHFSASVASSDVNEDDDLDESHPSSHALKDGEEIPLSDPSPVPRE